MARNSPDPLAIEHALLGFLRSQPMHGYEIYQHLTDPEGLWLVWRIKQSQLYALLIRLESEGYIASTLQPQDSRPPRKVFRLTRAGRERFAVWVRTAVPHGRDLRQDFLGKFFFARQEGPGVMRQLLAAQRVACQQWLAAMQSEAAAAGDDSFASLVNVFRIGQIKAMLGWLDAAERCDRLADNANPMSFTTSDKPFAPKG
jgi:DNA-binding PadR family transcriptional regulator